MTLALMLNRRAGNDRTRKLADYVLASFDRAGIDYTIVEGNSAADAIARAEGLVPNLTGVCSVGGDGSMHTALQVAFRHGLPLGIIASGSGDDAARALGLPHGRTSDATRRAVDHFVAAWTSQDITHVDALEATTADGNSHAVLAVISCGFDSRVSETSENMRYVRGTLRYILAMLKTLAQFQPIHYGLAINGDHKVVPAMVVAVGNGSMFGGGMKVLPDAKVNDGELDLLILHEVSAATLLRIFPRIFKGTHVTHPRVDTHRAQTVYLDAHGQRAWGDGEPLGPSPLQIEVRPGGVRVVGARV